MELSTLEMGQLEGGGFWSGVGCGLGIVGSFYALVSPDPFSKFALLNYGGTLLSCVTAFESSASGGN
jgi:hypothetical protein